MNKQIITAAAGSAAMTAVLIYGLSVNGCAGLPKTAPDATPHIEHAAEGVAKIPPLMDSNKAQTVDLMSKLPEPLQLKIVPNVSLIDTNSAQAKQEAITAAADLKKAMDQAEASNAANAQLQAANDKLEADLNEANQTKTRFILLLSVLTTMAGVGLFFYGNGKTGAAMAVAGVTGVVLSLMISQSGVFVGIGAGVILISVLAYMAWKHFITKKNLKVEQKATDELVATAEAIKAYLTPQQRAAIFGIGGAPGLADVLQSDQTQALVEQARGVTGPGTVRLTPSLSSAGTAEMVTPAKPAA